MQYNVNTVTSAHYQLILPMNYFSHSTYEHGFYISGTSQFGLTLFQVVHNCTGLWLLC